MIFVLYKNYENYDYYFNKYWLCIELDDAEVSCVESIKHGKIVNKHIYNNHYVNGPTPGWSKSLVGQITFQSWWMKLDATYCGFFIKYLTFSFLKIKFSLFSFNVDSFRTTGFDTQGYSNGCSG